MQLIARTGLGMLVALTLAAAAGTTAARAGDPAACASGAHSASAARPATQSEFEAFKQRYLDEYEDEVACWGKLAGSAAGAWASTTWVEAKADWDELKEATWETWEDSR